MKCFVFCLVVGLATVMGYPASETAAASVDGATATTSTVEEGLDTAYRYLQSCGDKEVTLCLKMRALTLVDKALRRAGDLDIVDGVTLVRSNAEGTRELGARALSEAELDASLPQNAEEKDQQVETLLFDRIARFFKSHTLQLKVPEAAISEVRQTLDEARGKKKKLKMLLPLLLLAKLKAATLIPLALGGLALLAFKALIIGKLALLIAGLIAVQKLLGSKHHGSSYEVVAHPHYSSHEEHSHGHGHGHYGRALPEGVPVVDAQQLAYSAYAKQE